MMAGLVQDLECSEGAGRFNRTACGGTPFARRATFRVGTPGKSQPQASLNRIGALFIHRGGRSVGRRRSKSTSG